MKKLPIAKIRKGIPITINFDELRKIVQSEEIATDTDYTKLIDFIAKIIVKSQGKDLTCNCRNIEEGKECPKE